jgi:DNA (cytosine-5)-methyltransferase 1
MRGLAPNEIIVDLFCGGGGATQGIEQAGYVVSECVNHCPTAIATHQANHPATNHRRGDVWENPPEMVAAGRPVGLLWASPDCRHFSRARGAAPVSRRVRDLAWVVTEWATSLPPAAPRVILVENVPEFVTWGPLRRKRDANNKPMSDAQGRALMEPVPERRGVTFKRWVRTLERAGYKVEWKVLDAADFGAASRRKRLFVMARRDGQPIVWPEASHGKIDALQGHDGSGQSRWRRGGHVPLLPISQASKSQAHDYARLSEFDGAGEAVHIQGGASRHSSYGSVREPHRRAADIIDWSDLGTSIFERERPLKDKTLARIAEGVRRYVLNDPAPFLLRVTQTGGGAGGGWHVSHVDASMPAQTTRQDLAVVSPVLATTGYGERDGQRPRVAHVAELLGTCVDGVKQAIASPVLAVCAHGDGHDGTKRWGRGALPVDESLNAIHAGGNNFALAVPLLQSAGAPDCRAVPASDALGTVLPRDHRAMVAPALAHLNHGGKQVSEVDDPLRTVVSGGMHHGIVAPVLVNNTSGHTGGSVKSPAPTITTGGHAALVAALMLKFYGNETGGQSAKLPLGTVTTLDRHAVVCVVLDGQQYVIVDILFRMLKPKELAAAMAFPAHYVWPRTQREAVRLIGNAVSPVMSEALTVAAIGEGPRREAGRNAEAA